MSSTMSDNYFWSMWFLSALLAAMLITATITIGVCVHARIMAKNGYEQVLEQGLPNRYNHRTEHILWKKAK
jgi:hypothetical protein